MRRNKPHGLNIARNTDQILDVIKKHHDGLPTKPDAIIGEQDWKKRKSYVQTSENQWTYDISCNEDFSLHYKFHNWESIFDCLDSEDIIATFATKFVNKHFLKYDPKYVRIRFSLMPEKLRSILEPQTSKTSDRIKAINVFAEHGYEVHINFSPIIISRGTMILYRELFEEVDREVDDAIKPFVKAECIMLTHNEKMHLHNLEEDPNAERYLWAPDRQEAKISSYGSKNIRYKRELKKRYIDKFRNLHNLTIPWNTIRYIF